VQIPAAREGIEIQQEELRASKAKAERRSIGWGNMVTTFWPPKNKNKGKSKGKGKGRNKERDSGEVKQKGKTISVEDDDDEASGSALKMAGALISLPVTLPLVLVASSGKMVFDSQVQGRLNRPAVCAQD
jgi:hypothetical protein